MKLYGSLNNRMEENKMFCEEIKVGTGMTRYYYSDREAWEVIEVKDQKHVTVRELDHELIGEAFSNDWKLTSNENNRQMDLVKRGNYWYSAITVTAEMVKKLKDDDVQERIYLALNGFDINKIIEKGHQTKYHKVDVSFGRADYYYDYEF